MDGLISWLQSLPDTEVLVAGRYLVIMAIVVLYGGEYLTSRSRFLQQNNIPASVTGGLLCSIVLALLSYQGWLNLSFDLELRNLLLLIFFSTIGLTARFSALLAGGQAIVLLVMLCTALILLQNAVGISLSMLLGEGPVLGLFAGSISLIGGHGTAIAWGEVARAHGFEGAAEFGIAAATLGLILGGLVGGPVAGSLIRRHRLRAPETEEEALPVAQSIPHRPATAEDFIGTILALGLCLAVGDGVNQLFSGGNINLPGFLTAMMVGVLIANLPQRVKTGLRLQLNPRAINIAGSVSLQLFLTMSLMSMSLLSLSGVIGALALIMFAQTLVAVLLAAFVVYRVMGKDYDAAVITGGFLGIGLGATPVALANMAAISDEHGPSVKALLVVPLVGAFFIDLVNAAVIQFILDLPLFN
ncbi:sodium/glutamate symporter [Aestuariirhabdus litorea]|uniref:Sodium/glutamate symporter n=1 Tax=Aestuariirhabdus litorea TaxID=2528527 RepID=A0A3P3VNJ4_9GAMM|nr:sodium/glutamate symporter [Aestuariirhabdus litorea]RRJ83994.1 sodium/glutamate symporter [Aestuariirhabdus litorea]RWW97214.1 sodium/glutamate symporter [Endozoicomonadaceae bacterium GTF-13]